MEGIGEEEVVVKTSASIWYVSSFLKLLLCMASNNFNSYLIHREGERKVLK